MLQAWPPPPHTPRHFLILGNHFSSLCLTSPSCFPPFFSPLPFIFMQMCVCWDLNSEPLGFHASVPCQPVYLFTYTFIHSWNLALCTCWRLLFLELACPTALASALLKWGSGLGQSITTLLIPTSLWLIIGFIPTQPMNPSPCQDRWSPWFIWLVRDPNTSRSWMGAFSVIVLMCPFGSLLTFPQ